MRKIQQTFKLRSQPDMIRKLVNIYACFFPEDNWLTDREKELFVEYVMCINSGNNPMDPVHRDKIQENMNLKAGSKAIYLYRTQLVKKGWIVFNKTDKTIDIPALFRFKGSILPINFNLDLIMSNGAE